MFGGGSTWGQNNNNQQQQQPQQGGLFGGGGFGQQQQQQPQQTGMSILEIHDVTPCTAMAFIFGRANDQVSEVVDLVNNLLLREVDCLEETHSRLQPLEEEVCLSHLHMG